ncbi:MAG: hypothetical protein DRG78_06575 [Epsilonproteobacteria bacterium]|nr:MAG: hypothetical protein DRG78_06575 [Campylobacterota bacterium]
MNTIDLSINITNSPHASSMVWASGEWNNTHKITKSFEYSAGYSPTGNRNNKSVKGVEAVILDFDDGIFFEEGIEVFNQYRSLCITTKSHQKNKNGLISDRFRVILPLDICIIDMKYYTRLMKVITRYYKSDIACTDSARYYSPSSNQLVHYSKSSNHFDIEKFDKLINYSEAKAQIHIKHPLSNEQLKKKATSSQQIDLTAVLNVNVNYYEYGVHKNDTLNYIIDSKETSNMAIKCRCFLNDKHEDKNPSCFIYINETTVYAKCMSCNRDGILYLIKGDKI